MEIPARENLAAAYQQEVNAELVSDSDKLIDESASLKSELARSEFELFPDGRGLAAVLKRSASGLLAHGGISQPGRGVLRTTTPEKQNLGRACARNWQSDRIASANTEKPA